MNTNFGDPKQLTMVPVDSAAVATLFTPDTTARGMVSFEFSLLPQSNPLTTNTIYVLIARAGLKTHNDATVNVAMVKNYGRAYKSGDGYVSLNIDNNSAVYAVTDTGLFDCHPNTFNAGVS